MSLRGAELLLPCPLLLATVAETVTLHWRADMTVGAGVTGACVIGTVGTGTDVGADEVHRRRSALNDMQLVAKQPL